MKRLLSIGGIPNVVSFTLPDKQFISALYDLGIIAYKKRKIENIISLPSNTKANKYIIKQSNRLLKYAKCKDWEKFIFLSKKIVTSYSFQINAYNSVYPMFTTLKLSTIRFHLRYIRTIAKRDATNVQSTRVWIDKLKGDYGRPLGVPDVCWRVYFRLILNLCEIATEGQGLYKDLQHGGRPGKGVATCLEEVLAHATKADTILEFDIKGFFDNISKLAMLKLIPSGWLRERVSYFIHSQPNKYRKFPNPTGNAQKVYLKKMKENPEFIQMVNDLEDYYPEFNLEAAFEDRTRTRKPDSTKFMIKDRLWGLNKPLSGVPQGTAFGSFLSSTAAANQLKDIPNLIMYCDDGVIFLKDGDPDPLPLLKEKLKHINLEIHPEKTKLRDKEYLAKWGLKFLGTRMFIRDGEVEMFSETRRGVNKPFADLLPHKPEYPDYKMSMTYLNKRRDIDVEKLMLKFKQRNISFKYLKEHLVRISLNYNFFSFLLARAYDPNIDEASMKQAIINGLTKADGKLRKNTLSLSFKLLENSMYHFTFKGKKRHYRPDIFNLSTFACGFLLKSRKAFLFERNL